MPSHFSSRGSFFAMVLNEHIKIDGASCTLWLEDSPQINGLKTATVGAFEARDIQSARSIIEHAVGLLISKNYKYVIGPMDGNTWHSYRFVVESEGHAPFFLEPQNPEFYPKAFLESGFEVIGDYLSSRDDQMHSQVDEEFQSVIDGYNVNIRSFDLKNAGRDLEKIYHLSTDKFSDNYLYTPISKDDFMALYQPILPVLDPRYVLLAEDKHQKLQAYAFAIPDYAQGEKPNQLIFKTYASTLRGLGRYLGENIMVAAKENGFTSMIHALIYDDNISKKTSGKYGTPIRKYALYGKAL